jgi:hypothetical protein
MRPGHSAARADQALFTVEGASRPRFRVQSLGLIWDSSCLLPKQNPRFTGAFKADEETRTPDLLHGKQTL